MAIEGLEDLPRAKRQQLIRERMTTVDGRSKQDLVDGAHALREETDHPAARATKAHRAEVASAAAVGNMIPLSQVQGMVSSEIDRQVGRLQAQVNGLREQVEALAERLDELLDYERSEAGRALQALGKNGEDDTPEGDPPEIPADDPAVDPPASGEAGTGEDPGKTKEGNPLKCTAEGCDFTAASPRGLDAHVRAKHTPV